MNPNVESLPYKRRGHPFLLGEEVEMEVSSKRSDQRSRVQGSCVGVSEVSSCQQ